MDLWMIISFLGTAVLLFSLISIGSSAIRGWLLRNPRISRRMNWIQGSIFILIGLKVALRSR